MDKYTPYPSTSFALEDLFVSFYEEGWRSLSVGKIQKRKKIQTLGKTLSYCPKHSTINLYDGTYEGTLNDLGELILFPPTALCESFQSATGKGKEGNEQGRAPVFIATLKETLENFPDTRFLEEKKESIKVPSVWALGIEYQTLHPEKGEGTKRFVALEGSFPAIHKYLLTMETKLKTREAYFTPTRLSEWKILHPSTKIQKVDYTV